jgi:hypothetical protein
VLPANPTIAGFLHPSSNLANISHTILSCSSQKGSPWLSSPISFPTAVPLSVMWFHPSETVEILKYSNWDRWPLFSKWLNNWTKKNADYHSRSIIYSLHTLVILCNHRWRSNWNAVSTENADHRSLLQMQKEQINESLLHCRKDNDVTSACCLLIRCPHASLPPTPGTKDGL